MKAVVKSDKQIKQQSKYPCILRCDDGDKLTIVLFTEELTGTCVFTNVTGSKLGEYYEYWAEESFTPFTGTIELSND